MCSFSGGSLAVYFCTNHICWAAYLNLDYSNMSSIPDVSLIANYNSIFWWEELFLVGGQKQTKKYRNLAEREFFFFSLPVCLENFKYKCNNFQQDHCIVKEHAPKIQNIRFQAWEYFEPLVHALLHCSSQVDSFCTFI